MLCRQQKDMTSPSPTHDCSKELLKNNGNTINADNVVLTKCQYKKDLLNLNDQSKLASRLARSHACGSQVRLRFCSPSFFSSWTR